MAKRGGKGFIGPGKPAFSPAPATRSSVSNASRVASVPKSPVVRNNRIRPRISPG